MKISIDEKIFNDIKEKCMIPEIYDETVKQEGEPKDYEAFINAYALNDRIDRNHDARVEHQKTQKEPSLSEMTSDPIKYQEDYKKFMDLDEFPVKYFTDVMREECGIDWHADEHDRLIFETVNDDKSVIDVLGKKLGEVEQEKLNNPPVGGGLGGEPR